MKRKLQTAAALACLMAFCAPGLPAKDCAESALLVETAIQTQILQQSRQANENLLKSALAAVQNEDTEALRNAVQAGVNPNKRYSLYEGVNLLGLAIGSKKWKSVIFLLQEGGDIKLSFRNDPGSFPLSEALSLMLEADNENVSDPYFWQCLLVAAHEGYYPAKAPDAPFPNNYALGMAYHTWKLVSLYKCPVVFAAAFNNNMELLLALDINSDDDEVFRLQGEKGIKSLEGYYNLFTVPHVYSLQPGVGSNATYWVEKWQAIAGDGGFYVDVKYKKILDKFKRP